MILIVIVAVIGTSTSGRISEQYAELADVDLPLIAALEEIKLSASRLISSTNEFVLDAVLGLDETGAEAEAAEADEADESDEDEGERAEIAEAIEDYETAFAVYSAIESESGDDLAHLTGVEASGQALIDNALAVVALTEAGAPIEDITEARSQFEILEGDFLETVDAVIDDERARVESIQSEISTLVTNSGLVLGLLGVLTMVVSVIGGVYLVGSITRRLRALQTTADGLRAGRFDLRADAQSSDELGAFAQTFNTMAERIEGLVGDLKHQVTVAEQARARAEQSDQAKSAFLASMSHELRTPLNAIINFTRFVAKGSLGPVNSEQRDTLGEVIESGRHLLSLINDVLDMSKIEAGSLTLFAEDGLELPPIIEQAASTGRTLLAEKPVTLRTEIASDLPTLHADRQRLTQVLLNLVSNACKFTDEGEVVLRAAYQNGEVVLSVRDTGIGIAPEDRTSVFEAFKQTESGLRQGGGTGLGLPISKSLVEAHGGRLWLESTLGQGTTFYVALPAPVTALESAAAVESV